MPILNKWLARFSFSLLILCGLLAWTAYKEAKLGGFSPRTAALLLGAVAVLFGGLMGIRARHRAVLEEFERAEKVESDSPRRS
jgi:hypothetical protein